MKSYFVDTNYFLRLFIKDNGDQYDTVYDLFKQAIEGRVHLSTSVVVFFEIYWVLSSFYNDDKKQAIGILRKVLQMDFLSIENKALLRASLELFEITSIEPEDCYNVIYLKSTSLSNFATFDKKVLSVLKQLHL